MISTFSTEMPGFLHKQASDESSCIDFLYISGLPDSKKRQRNYFLCRLYSLFFLYTEFFRILQLSLLHTQGSELHRLCLQHRHRLHLLLPLHLHPVLSVLHLLPEVRYDQCLVSITQIDAAPDWCLIYISLFHPVIAFYWRHKILSLIFTYIFHHFNRSPFLFVFDLSGRHRLKNIKKPYVSL